MNMEIEDRGLRSLYTDRQETGGFPAGVVNRFRFVLGYVAQMQDERDLRVYPGWRFEKLKGNRSHQHSLRLNDQYRLIVELRGEGQQKRIAIIAIEDYH